MTQHKTERGRPAVPDELRRDKRVPIVMTQTEYEQVKQAAENVGLTVSTFGRQAILAAAKKRR